jgi:hypothetical protein
MSRLDIACDEAGHTGPDLLHKDQRYFAYASVAVTDAEASEIILQARVKYPVQMSELKASRLMGSSQGRRLIVALLNEIQGRYIVSINDKLLALCGWFFEYIYEPVYQADPRLLYEKDLHRFVAMYAWLWMRDNESQARPTIEQFQRYMRSRDPADAPFLFDRPRPPLSLEGTEHPFETVLRFAYGYRDIIIVDNARLDTELPDHGRWTLDLSTSGLWSHLNHWGSTRNLLSVRCDASKPLQANIENFTGDEDDPAIWRARRFHKPQRLGWKLVEPIAFVDSRNHPAIQLADVIASAMVTIVKNDYSQDHRAVAEVLFPHVHEHSIMPDMDVIDPATRNALVNSLILFDLAKRAERHADPYRGLAEMYHIAEVSFARG